MFTFELLAALLKVSLPQGHRQLIAAFWRLMCTTPALKPRLKSVSHDHYFLLYQVDIFQKDLLLIPIHLEVHWSLVSVDIPRRAITYFDSQRTLNRRCPKVRMSRSGWIWDSLIKTFFFFLHLLSSIFLSICKRRPSKKKSKTS